uniref:RNase H type-1 domain-containing protein n=1 Tax=Nelumbo nucifera TaxID=4432 RepID=A0A822Z1U0_NELNU|nr:TPA_asm: hypothetical protein HUJ06_013295 [Nelumbo nucifera]
MSPPLGYPDPPTTSSIPPPTTTNIVAEWRATWDSISYAKALGILRLVVESDLMIQVLTGNSEPPWNILSWLGDITDMTKSMEVHYTHILSRGFSAENKINLTGREAKDSPRLAFPTRGEKKAITGTEVKVTR